MRVVHFGLGPIGLETLQMVADRPDCEIVGAVDIDPAKVGRDVGDLAGLGKELGVVVEDNAAQTLQRTQPDVVVHSTGSALKGVFPQLQSIVEANADIVSTCEELSYPWKAQRLLAEQLNDLALAHGVSVLGTGVNPGFVMDLLPAVLSAVTFRVRSVRVLRVVDASHRREPLQRKIGAGISREEFAERAAGGQIGHVGLPESLDMLAAALGWECETVDNTLEPAIATAEVTTPYLRVPPGSVAGIHQVARGQTADGRSIELELLMHVGAKDPRDEVTIEGSPGARLLIPGGIFGDSATAAIASNAVPAIHRAPPGLHTMLDLPPVTARSRS